MERLPEPNTFGLLLAGVLIVGLAYHLRGCRSTRMVTWPRGGPVWSHMFIGKTRGQREKRRPSVVHEMTCYPANLCPLGFYVLNEVRRLADDPLSHPNRTERKADAEWAASVTQKRDRPAEFDQFRTKKYDGTRRVSRPTSSNIGRYICCYR
jgi:hypothetical protein